MPRETVGPLSWEVFKSSLSTGFLGTGEFIYTIYLVFIALSSVARIGFRDIIQELRCNY